MGHRVNSTGILLSLVALFLSPTYVDANGRYSQKSSLRRGHLGASFRSLYSRPFRNFPQLQRNLVAIQAEKGTVDNAQEAVKEGLRLLTDENFEKALKVFERGLGLPSGQLERKYPMPLPNKGGGSYQNAKISNKEIRALLYNIACCHSRMGQQELALGALQQCVDAGFKDADTIQRDPDLSSLKSSPKFAQILERTKAKNPLDWILSGFNPE
eukprot:jgi/Bigna1/77383/fgenesh1_pg.47_\